MESKDFTALGGLFQMIISDLKSGIPLWEDFLYKASKFHSQLKATVNASGAFLDSFQKIADMATSARGATKDIGTALTRLCLRHRSVETKFKAYAGSLMDCLIIPLQERMEEWKKITYQLDKDHSKEYKKVRQEIKKKSTDTLRLQKKVRKVGICDIRRTLDSALQDVNDKYNLLEETEKLAVRKVLIEERSRFCLLIAFLEPVVKSELLMLQEMTHLQEVLDALTTLAKDPNSLPVSSEEILIDMKNSESSWSFQTPPSSPSSLGSRKSSACSISSLNSSSSNGNLSRSSSHRSRQWSIRQEKSVDALCCSNECSHDSGFTSQDTIYTTFCPPPPPPRETLFQTSSLSKYSSVNSVDACSTSPSPVSSTPVTATWPSLQDNLQNEQLSLPEMKYHRPHTISSAYEHSGHSRPALTTQTFQPLVQEKILSVCKEDYCDLDIPPVDYIIEPENAADYSMSHDKNSAAMSDPPIPERTTSKSQVKPYVPEKSPFIKAKHIQQLLLYGSPSKSLSVPDFNRTPSDQVMPHPIYANINELCLKVTSKTASLPTRHGCNKLTFQKDLAKVLAKGLLPQQSNSDDEIIKQERNKQIFDRKSTDSVIEEFCFENDSLYEDIELPKFDFIQERPASYAGSSNASLSHRGSNVIQKSGNNNRPPPTPVRRSSSISSQSLEKLTVHHKSPEANNCNMTASNTSGINDYHELESQPLKENGLQQSSENTSTEVKKSDKNDNSAHRSTSWEEKDFRNDVFESRTRFLQALNATLTFQNRHKLQDRRRSEDAILSQNAQGRKQIQAMVLQFQNQAQLQTPPPKQQPFVKADILSEETLKYQDQVKQHSKEKARKPPPRDSSLSRSANSIERANNDNENIFSGDRETLVHRFSMKIPPREPRPPQRKASLADPTCSKVQNPQAHKTVQSHCQKHGSQQSIQLKLSDQLDKSENYHQLPVSALVENKSFRQNFLASLNSKLARQNQLDQSTHVSGTKENKKDFPVFRRDSRSSTFAWERKHSRENVYSDTPTAKVQRWLARRDNAVIAPCCDTLMDQIRRGTSLRKVTCNDRSAPRLS